MGQPVAFPLASSSVRPDDRPGDLVRADPDSIRELPPLQGLMRVGRKAKAERVPVRLAARVTEVGTVELWCQSRTDDRRWRLQIQLRGPAGQPTPQGTGHGPGDRPRRHRAVRDRRGRRGDPRRVPGRHVVAARRTRPRPADQAAGRGARRAARPVAALGLAGVLGAAQRPGRPPAQEPAARVALVQPRRLRPPARPRVPARRGPDQGALADLPPGRPPRQGRAVLGRVVDPLAAGGGGPGPRPPRGDPSPAGAVPPAGQGHEPGEEERAAQARAPRAGRDVAVRRQPGTALARDQGDRSARC